MVGRGELTEKAWEQLAPLRRDQHEQRGRWPGRPLVIEAGRYRRRNVVERCMNRLQHWWGLATRYQKRAANYPALVVSAALMR